MVTHRPSLLADAVRVFSSEQAIIDYVRSEDYDTPSGTPFGDDAHQDFPPQSKEGSDQIDGEQSQGSQARQERRSKVGMAVIFNQAPLEGEVPQWDYTLRLNYTYGVSQFEEQVRVRVGDERCRLE